MNKRSSSYQAVPLILRARNISLPIDRTVVMGVLNVTPDSFSDGGLWFDAEAAIEHGRAMARQGAAIIDVGGESTRPGAEPVPQEEELRRVVPVIEALARDPAIPISIDTRKPDVARAAVEAGAAIVNDTSGEVFDPHMDDVVAETGAAVAIMHSRGTPQTMRSLTDYENVIEDVRAFLMRRTTILESAGVASESIAIDPGIGFAKTPAQNLMLLNGLARFIDTGYPVLIGTSRKSFIGVVLDVPEDQRVEGTIASVVWAMANGVHIVRVHDVVEVARAVKMTEAIMHPADHE